jgi:hypothetical protein
MIRCAASPSPVRSSPGLRMTDSSYLPPVRLEAARERIVAELSEHFAHDHLDTAEFENRLDRAYRATTLAQLEALRADLPALATEQQVARRPTSAVALADETEVRDRQVVFAMMGGSERTGSWVPARTIDALAIMGGIGLDFRQARFAPGVTTVNAAAIMGGIEILVPPGIRVESNGIGIMGGFESFDQTGDSDDPDAPVLRISGIALMGAVEIKQRLPGETEREARLRRKEERRHLREAHQRRRLHRGDP